MPAVEPAEVMVCPSRTKIRSGSTATRGWRRASSAQNAQCVVAALPSSSPAAASRNAPVQTEQVRRAPAETRCSPEVETRIADDLADAHAAADDQRVDRARADVAERLVGGEPHARRSAHRRAVGRGDHHPVAAVAAEHLRGGVEHLGRADEVEQLHAVEADEHDLAFGRRHEQHGDLRVRCPQGRMSLGSGHAPATAPATRWYPCRP